MAPAPPWVLAQGVTRSTNTLSRILDASTPAGPNPEVTLLYEDFSTGLSAKKLFDRLLNGSPREATYRLSMWKFNLLRVRPLLTQAAQDAAAAGILCVAAHADGDLPTEVSELVSEALRQRQPAPTALVVLLETPQSDATAELPAMEAFRKVAAQTGAEFFFHCLETRPDQYETTGRRR